MSPEASKVLSRYYQLQRQADLRNVARTTVRLLESLIRLSQAHARLMFRSVVEIADAIVAVTLVESSMQTSALLGVSSALHSSFPDDGDAEFARQKVLILKRLGLENLLPPSEESPPGSPPVEEMPHRKTSQEAQPPQSPTETCDADLTLKFLRDPSKQPGARSTRPGVSLLRGKIPSFSMGVRDKRQKMSDEEPKENGEEGNGQEEDPEEALGLEIPQEDYDLAQQKDADEGMVVARNELESEEEELSWPSTQSGGKSLSASEGKSSGGRPASGRSSLSEETLPVQAPFEDMQPTRLNKRKFLD